MNPFRTIAKFLDPKTRMHLPAVGEIVRSVTKSASSTVATRPPADLTAVRVGDDTFRKRRAERGRNTKRAYVLLVLVPTGLAGIYYSAIASDRYTSEAQIIVSGDESSVPNGNPLYSLLAGANINVAETFLVYNYVQSNELVTKLDPLVNLRGIYSSVKADWLSRLSTDATEKDLAEFFRRHVEIIAEPNNPVLKIRAEAFTPAEAQQVLKGIIRVAEENLNTFAAKKRQDSIGFAVEELQKAQRHRMDVQNRLAEFRRRHGEIDPVKAASAYGGIVTTLTQSLINERSKLEAMMTYAKPNNPEAVAQKAKVRAIEKELKAARLRLAGSKQSVYAPLVDQYESLLLEQKMADDEYADSRKLVEMVRTEATRRHAYVMEFVRPGLPDEATQPERVKSVAIAFAACNILFAIGFLGLTAVREQSTH